jgi:hypothetical protein
MPTTQPRQRISDAAIADLNALNAHAHAVDRQLRRQGLFVVFDLWSAELAAGLRTRETRDLLHLAAVNEAAARFEARCALEPWPADAIARFTDRGAMHVAVRDQLLELLEEDDA